MPKFSANLSMLFTEVPFVERFGAAARAGFAAVEYVGPYEHSPEDIAKLLRSHGLKQVLFNLPAGDWAAGERGIACLPGREDEFRQSVETAIRYARALECPRLNCLAGIKPPGVTDAEAEAALIANLRFAAGRFEAAGIELLVEPINTYDMPGFFLNRSAQAMALFDKVGHGNLGLQYDIYHMQRMEGELAATIERLLPRIGHFQIAGNPGRTEPDRGEINYAFLFELLDRLGYQGWIGAEYRPVGNTAEGLGWLRRFAGK
jgi:hydroxypyruvate isomerase